MFRALALVSLLLALLALGGCGGAPTTGGEETDLAADTVDTAGTHTIVLPAVADTVLDEAHPAQNYGLGKNVQVGYFYLAPSVPTCRRALLRFDLSSIPAGATISKAALQVYQTFFSGVPTGVRSYRVTKSWTETGATWSGNASFFSTAYGFYSCTSATTNHWASFNILGLARSWLSVPGRNFGVMLKTVEYTEYNREVFDSREATTVAQRPRLKIVYTD